MRKEITTPTLIGVIIAVIAVIGVIGFILFRPASSGPASKAAVQQLKDPASFGKGGEHSEKDTPIPPDAHGPNGGGQ